MRVLLVEDDTSTAKSVELVMKSEGFVVDTTDLGEDGLEIGKLHDYDIIILDLMLPAMRPTRLAMRPATQPIMPRLLARSVARSVAPRAARRAGRRKATAVSGPAGP